MPTGNDVKASLTNKRQGPSVCEIKEERIAAIGTFERMGTQPEILYRATVWTANQEFNGFEGSNKARSFVAQKISMFPTR